MQCNIDARGKAIRFMAGAIVEGLGLLLVILAAVGMIAGTWPYVVGGLMVVGGWVMIFEAISGWCVVRAMGFRTPV